MKSILSVVALTLVLCCASLTCAIQLDRSLKQTCPSPVPTTRQDVNIAARSIARALSRAVVRALGTADVQASSFAFAQTMETIYARLIIRHIWRTSVAGVSACDPGPDYVGVTRVTISEATRQGFSGSSNAAARAAATCFAEAVSSAAATATQPPSCQICASNFEDPIVQALETNGFSGTVATAFMYAFTAIRNASPTAACPRAQGSTSVAP